MNLVATLSVTLVAILDPGFRSPVTMQFDGYPGSAACESARKSVEAQIAADLRNERRFSTVVTLCVDPRPPSELRVDR